jgi:hypothetical protein
MSSLDRLGQTGRGLLSSFNRDGANTLQDMILSAADPSRADVSTSLDQASAGSDRSFDAATGTLGRQTRALGTAQNAGQEASTNRRIGLARALSAVDSRNRTVGAIRQRRDMAMSTAGSLRDVLASQQLDVLSNAAQMQGARIHNTNAARAGIAADSAATTGQSLGMLGSMFGGK